MKDQVSIFAASDNTLGECPLWDSLRQALWWIDVASPSLWCRDNKGDLLRWPLPKPPTALAFRGEDQLLIFFRRGITSIAIDELSHDSVIHVDTEFSLGDERFNDAAVSPDGCIFVGTMDRKQRAPIGKLYTVDKDCGLTAVDEGFQLSNGLGWSPDGSTLYFAETASRNIYAYRYLPGGRVSGRRIFAHIEGEGGPDGLTVDSKGNIWVALFKGGEVRCFLPNGQVHSRHALPTRYPTSCGFGGDDWSTLFVTTAKLILMETNEPATAWDGAVLALKTGDVGRQDNSVAP